MFGNWVIIKSILDDDLCLEQQEIIEECVQSIKLVYTSHRNRYCETFNDWQYV
jgi:hypothetical protein